MIGDIDDLLEELAKAIGLSLQDLDAGRVVKSRKAVGGDTFKITSTFSIGPAIPEVARPEPPVKEPLVDVFEDGNRVRLVVELPGIKKDDVHVSLQDGSLRIDVVQGGKVHTREVP